MNLENIQAKFAQRRSPIPEAGWFDALQQRGFESFTESGFPTTRQEHWKYTSTKALQKLSFDASGSGAVDAHDVTNFLIPEVAATTLVFVNGVYKPQLSSGPSEDGITVAPFGEALARHPESLESHLGSLAGFESKPDWSFTALNTALFEDGVFVFVPRNASGGVIHVVHLQDASAGETSSHPRALVVLEENSSATLIQSYGSLGAAATFTNAVTEVVVGDGARLDHLVWGREGTSAYHVGRVEVRLGRDATYSGTSVWTGGLWSRLDTDICFSAEGAECTLNGLYIGGDNQHIDHHTSIEHAVPHCTSSQTYKGVLGGSSKAVFNGRIHIHPDAQRSDSAMSNRNLLLTESASVNTKPELEIYADDVKASHGTTVGQLDENAIYYFRTRGIPTKVAERMLTSAFAADVLEPIRLEGLHAAVRADVEFRLNQIIGD